MRLVRLLEDLLAFSQQHRLADALFGELLRRAEDARMIPLGKRDARHAPARAGDDHRHHFVGAALTTAQ